MGLLQEFPGLLARVLRHAATWRALCSAHACHAQLHGHLVQTWVAYLCCLFCCHSGAAWRPFKSLPRLILLSLWFYRIFCCLHIRKHFHSVIWVGLLARKTLCMQSPFACLMFWHLYLCSIIMPKAKRVFVEPAGNGYVLGVCIHMLRRPILGVARVYAWIVTVKTAICTRVGLMQGASILQSLVVVRFALRKW